MAQRPAFTLRPADSGCVKAIDNRCATKSDSNPVSGRNEVIPQGECRMAKEGAEASRRKTSSKSNRGAGVRDNIRICLSCHAAALGGGCANMLAIKIARDALITAIAAADLYQRPHHRSDSICHPMTTRMLRRARDTPALHQTRRSSCHRLWPAPESRRRCGLRAAPEVIPA